MKYVELDTDIGLLPAGYKVVQVGKLYHYVRPDLSCGNPYTDPFDARQAAIEEHRRKEEESVTVDFLGGKSTVSKTYGIALRNGFVVSVLEEGLSYVAYRYVVPRKTVKLLTALKRKFKVVYER